MTTVFRLKLLLQRATEDHSKRNIEFLTGIPI